MVFSILLTRTTSQTLKSFAARSELQAHWRRSRWKPSPYRSRLWVEAATAPLQRRGYAACKIAEKEVQEPPKSYTTSFALIEALWESGTKTIFCNVGSDHPSILEAIVAGKRLRPNKWPKFITCPAEVTAISMADGHSRVTGQPTAVLVHVDVGTQALAQGLHNASIGRAPVFIFAGMCPYTESGELPGSRTEYMHWLQEAPDQKAIVRQYCRYTGEVRTGLNVKQNVARALQFAKSAPKGPVYLAAAREVLAQEIEPYELQQDQWGAVGPGALPDDAVRDVCQALVSAEQPLVITGYSGRDRRCPELLVKLADLVPGLRVHDTGGSDVCFPFSHPASLGFRLSFDECTKDADTILLLDCDVPWIPSKNAPKKDTLIYHIDIDPLNQQIPVSFFPAHGRWKADSYAALMQLVSHLKDTPSITSALQDPKFSIRKKELASSHHARVEQIASFPDISLEARLTPHNIGHILKQILPPSTTYVVEAVTAAQSLHDQLQPDRPGSWINCGATGIGWSNGAALGVKMALEKEVEEGRAEDGIVCQIVGDGSFMCAAPESAVWVGRKYEIPMLTIVLNNGGWKAPRNSTNLVYPDGLNTDATDDEMNISFRPSPNYAAMAEAAAGEGFVVRGLETPFSDKDKAHQWMKGLRVETVRELIPALRQAVNRVGKKKTKKSMLIEIFM